MSKALYEINLEAKGLEGFVLDLGTELKETLSQKFSGRVKKHNIDVEYKEYDSELYFDLCQILNGKQYYFIGEFSLEQKDPNKPKLIISRSRGVKIVPNLNQACSKVNQAHPKALQEELRNVASMEDEVIEFLKNKFGNPAKYQIYNTKLPDKYFLDE